MLSFPAPPQTERASGPCHRCQALPHSQRALIHATIEKLAPPPRATSAAHAQLASLLPLAFASGTPCALAKDDAFIAVTPGWTAALGYSAAETIGQSVTFNLVGLASPANPYDTLHFPVALRHKDGHLVHATLTRYPLLVGDELFHIGILTDVTP